VGFDEQGGVADSADVVKDRGDAAGVLLLVDVLAMQLVERAYHQQVGFVRGDLFGEPVGVIAAQIDTAGPVQDEHHSLCWWALVVLGG
jgi:hypothetical protein